MLEDLGEKKFINQDVAQEYRRITDTIGPADPYLGKYTIGIHEVLEAHFLLADFFFETGEGIGGVGPKDMNMLHSALARQFIEFGGKPKYKDRRLIPLTTVPLNVVVSGVLVAARCADLSYFDGAWGHSRWLF